MNQGKLNQINMKKTIYQLAILFSLMVITMAFSNIKDSNPNVEFSAEKVTVKLKGTGSKHITVKVGVGSKVGGCERGCYKTIGPNTTVSIQANVGDVIWDADRKTTILKISSGMDGDVIDLKNYY